MALDVYTTTNFSVLNAVSRSEGVASARVDGTGGTEIAEGVTVIVPQSLTQEEIYLALDNIKLRMLELPRTA